MSISSVFSTVSQDEPSEWVKIKSEDGFSFIVPRKAVQISGTLKTMLDRTYAFHLHGGCIY